MKIKYCEAFDKYKAFLVKHAETVAIKQLIDKLNADVLQIYNEDTGENCSVAISHANSKEDLVAQALLTVEGMTCFLLADNF